jgi:FkbM family methyltransferase
MKLRQRYLLLKKCMGEARWNSRFPTFAEKREVFKVLYGLRYAIEIEGKGEEPVTHKVFDFNVSGTTYNELLYLFREIFMNGQYEFKFSGDEPQIVDAGANVGMAILYFKRRYPKCKIIAFEPNPRIFKLLQQNVEGNGLRDVTLHNVALSDKDGTIDFFVNPGNSLVSSIEKSRGGDQYIHIPTVRLSTHLSHAKFHFAKIDVEGAEQQIINDLKSTGTITQVDQYIFEYHHNIKGAGFKLSEFLKVFEDSGFSFNVRGNYDFVGDVQDIEINVIKSGASQ